MASLSVCLPSNLSLAAAFDLIEGQDVAFRTGGMFGQIQTPEVKKGEPIDIGGATVGVAFHRDFSHDFVGYLEPTLAIDANTQSVLKKGVALGWGYHLLGGAKEVHSKLLVGEVTERETSSISLLARGGYFEYSASSGVEAGAVVVKGSVIETSAGFEYRQDFFGDTSFGTQLMSTVLTFPSGTENLKSSIIEVNLFLRVTL